MKKKLFITAIMLLICSILVYGVKKLQVNIYNSQSKVQQEENTAKPLNVDENVVKQVENKNDESALGNSDGNDTVQQTKKEQDFTEMPKDNASSKISEPIKETNSKDSEKEQTKATSPDKVVAKTRDDDNSTKKAPEQAEEPIQNINFKIIDNISGKTVIQKEVQFDGKTLLNDIMLDVLKKAKESGEISGYTIRSGYVSMIDGLKERSPEAASGWIYYVNGQKVDFGIKDVRAAFPKGTIVEFKFYKDALNEK